MRKAWLAVRSHRFVLSVLIVLCLVALYFVSPSLSGMVAEEGESGNVIDSNAGIAEGLDSRLATGIGSGEWNTNELMGLLGYA